MSLSTLPLSYCTNVHPGMTMDAVIEGLTTYTAQLRARLDRSVAAGLWLAEPVIGELASDSTQLARLHDVLAQHELVCYTLNAFPYGDFHSERVKENVYLPDWSDTRRLDYTLGCARALSSLLPAGVEGSISTVPLGFKEFDHPDDFSDRCVANLLSLAQSLDELHDETGQVIRLAIEPEPFCILETTAETIAFFERLFDSAEQANLAAVARRHLGVCYDVCHQSVEFEDVAASIRQLREAEIRINKVHITCAIQVVAPGDDPTAREALARYVEPRYLHQTMARSADGAVLRVVDLSRELALEPTAEFRDASMWRVHFHVPVNAESLGPLQTTRDDLRRALVAVAELDYAPHLEVETYTWEVLPDGSQTSLVDGLSEELRATHSLLSDIQNSGILNSDGDQP